jgi:hypothetical protein
MQARTAGRQSKFRLTLAGWIVLLAAAVICVASPAGRASAQQPTGSIPTVTGTPTGPEIIVYSDHDSIGVFAGPSSYLYDQVGILLAGEKAPALGYSTDQQWIQIIYMGVQGGKGWVYAPFVSMLHGPLLAFVPNPPTATPRTTPTLNPTLVAALGVDINPTRLPTFTAPPPLQIPTFDPAPGNGSRIPLGFVILVLALIGVLGAMISFLRGR